MFLPNKEEGAILTGLKDPEAIARDLTEIYAGSLVILKLDADGALAWLDGSPHHIPPATNNLVDATGAGDSFAGAFLARLLSGATPLEAATFATSISAWVIEHPGRGRRSTRARVAADRFSRLNAGGAGTRGRCGGRRRPSSSTIASCGSWKDRTRPSGSCDMP